MDDPMTIDEFLANAPEPTFIPVNVKIPMDLARDLIKNAEENDRSTPEQIVWIIKQHLWSE